MEYQQWLENKGLRGGRDHQAAVLWLWCDFLAACSFLRLRTKASSLLRSSCSACMEPI